MAHLWFDDDNDELIVFTIRQELLELALTAGEKHLAPVIDMRPLCAWHCKSKIPLVKLRDYALRNLPHDNQIQSPC